MALHECKIYDGKGKLKQTVGFKQINEKYWQQFYIENASYVNVPDLATQTWVKRKQSYTIKCKVCKKEAQAIRKNTRYCSPLCKGRRARVKKEARLEEAAARRYNVKCKICEKDWQAVKPNYKYCGTECKREANNLKNRRAGEKSKANIAKRKLELAECKAQILQRQHSPTSKGGEVREAHPV
tara:strand:+ start:183 stop:731 length:549 start_codon:yes stop_codon:yes gene_type:complete